eukprot:jgi/Chlat1/4754/Chrsp308S04729
MAAPSGSRKEIKQVCVYCGARAGDRPEYMAAARDLGLELVGLVVVRRGMGLVYGGGSVGMMGGLAQAVHEAGGSVLGVIPTALKPVELSGECIGTIIETESMHERKAVMMDHADAFIALPGGVGTLEELVEMMTWSQLGIHAKPLGILNVAGFFDHLLAFLKHATDEGFIREQHRRVLVAHDNPADLLDALQAYEPAPALVQPDRWQQQQPKVKG